MEYPLKFKLWEVYSVIQDLPRLKKLEILEKLKDEIETEFPSYRDIAINDQDLIHRVFDDKRKIAQHATRLYVFYSEHDVKSNVQQQEINDYLSTMDSNDLYYLIFADSVLTPTDPSSLARRELSRRVIEGEELDYDKLREINEERIPKSVSEIRRTSEFLTENVLRDAYKAGRTDLSTEIYETYKGHKGLKELIRVVYEESDDDRQIYEIFDSANNPNRDVQLTRLLKNLSFERRLKILTIVKDIVPNMNLEKSRWIMRYELGSDDLAKLLAAILFVYPESDNILNTDRETTLARQIVNDQV